LAHRYRKMAALRLAEARLLAGAAVPDEQRMSPNRAQPQDARTVYYPRCYTNGPLGSPKFFLTPARWSVGAT